MVRGLRIFGDVFELIGDVRFEAAHVLYGSDDQVRRK